MFEGMVRAVEMGDPRYCERVRAERGAVWYRFKLREGLNIYAPVDHTPSGAAIPKTVMDQATFSQVRKNKKRRDSVHSRRAKKRGIR